MLEEIKPFVPVTAPVNADVPDTDKVPVTDAPAEVVAIRALLSWFSVTAPSDINEAMVSEPASSFISKRAVLISNVPVPQVMSPALPECVICKSSSAAIFIVAPSSHSSKLPFTVGLTNLFFKDSYVNVAIIYLLASIHDLSLDTPMQSQPLL